VARSVARNRNMQQSQRGGGRASSRRPSNRRRFDQTDALGTNASTTPLGQRTRKGLIDHAAASPIGPATSNVPSDYPEILGIIKARIQKERLRTVLAANSAMVLLYWDIGRTILERQQRSGWGAKIIDRLAADLRDAYPDMKGLSPRNLKYMRAFAAARPDGTIVQGPLAQITWGGARAWPISSCAAPISRYSTYSVSVGPWPVM